MTKRGKILRDTNAGPGLLVVDGTQYPFQLEGTWKSELPPKTGMIVEVDFDEAQKIAGIRAVPEAQIAKEQAELALAAVKEKGAAMAGAMVARFGAPSLVAAGLLIVGWFFLNAGSFGNAAMGKLDFTFWQVLGFLNSGFASVMQRMSGSGGSTGIYGFLAVAAIAGPFLHHFWKDRRAHLGGLLPLAVMLLAVVMIFTSISSATGDSNGLGAGGAEAQQMREQMAQEMRNAISIGLGTYLSFGVSLYFAGTSLKRFLVAGA